MSEQFRLLDKYNIILKDSGTTACFADLREPKLDSYPSFKYLEVYGCYAAFPIKVEQREKFKPFVASLQDLLKIVIEVDEQKYTYKIDVEKYPADVVMTFLRSMSIIQEGGSTSYCMELFHTLLTKKVHPHLAVVACILVGSCSGSSTNIGLTSCRYSSNHSAIYDDNVTVKTFFALQSGKWRPNPQQKSLKEQRGYKYGFSSLIGDHQTIRSNNDFTQSICKEKMEKAKFHPFEIPVLYMLQFKYGKMCTMEEYASSVLDFGLGGTYNTGTDWIYSVKSQLRGVTW